MYALFELKKENYLYKQFKVSQRVYSLVQEIIIHKKCRIFLGHKNILLQYIHLGNSLVLVSYALLILEVPCSILDLFTLFQISSSYKATEYMWPCQKEEVKHNFNGYQLQSVTNNFICDGNSGVTVFVMQLRQNNEHFSILCNYMCSYHRTVLKIMLQAQIKK